MSRGLKYILALLFTAAPLLVVLAQGEPTVEEAAESRRKLQQWRKHPEQLQQLRQNYQAFLALTQERREQILKLDQDLHEENAYVQARLFNVMDRYGDWLERLDPKDRQRVKDAPDKAARLALIKELRDQEWMRLQPKAQREKYAALQGKVRADYIQQLRRDEKQRKQEWLLAHRFWTELEKKAPLPARLSDFHKDIETYVNEFLRFMMTPEEKERLDKAQGQWPLFPMTLVEIADRHPPALPGPDGPKTLADLPTDVKNKLFKKPPLKIKIQGEGRWPAFAVGVTELAAKRGVVLPHEIWPTAFNGLSPGMQDFVKNRLEPILTPQEQARLARAEQIPKWPDYPELIQELAKNHNLTVPWQTLPPRDRWDSYRMARAASVQGLPEVPDHQLRDFAFFVLSDKQREELQLHPNDPASLERLRRAYFQHYPQELERLQKNRRKKQS